MITLYYLTDILVDKKIISSAGFNTINMTDNSVEAYLFFWVPSILPQMSRVINCYFMGKNNDNITVSLHKLTKEISFRHHFKICHSANNTTNKRWLTTYEYQTVTKETVHKYNTFIIVANDEFCYIKQL